MSESIKRLDASKLKAALHDGGEIALLDAREEVPFDARHLLLAACVPLGRVEAILPASVPRRGTRIVWCDDGERDARGRGLAERAAGYGIHWAKCMGHDLYEVRETMHECLELAPNESKPSVVEIDTYRYRGHSVADPDKTYRTRDEIDEYRKNKDPISVFQKELIAEGVLNEDLVKEIDNAAREEADTAADFAEASPFPTPADIQTDVYWEADNADQRVSGGRLFFS